MLACGVPRSARLLSLIALPAFAADYPAPKEGDWVAKDFRFHTGEVMPEVRLHYTTIGEPTGEPVLMLHGTAGSARSMLTPAFAGELFGAGQPLDATKYFIILPDAIGAGKSAKPSDGLRAKFPRYNYDDMVAAQYRLVTEGLGIRHLRLVIGNSMGGMQTWHVGLGLSGLHGRAGADGVAADRDVEPQLDDAADDHRLGPQRSGLEERQLHDAAAGRSALANVFFGIATSGGTLAYQKLRADAREGRQAARTTAGGAVQRRRQRLPLSVGFLARLQRVAGAGEDQGGAAGDQLGRRRAQSAGNRASWSASSSA